MRGGFIGQFVGYGSMAACIKFRAFVPIVAEYDSIMDKLASCAYDGSPRPLCLAKAVQANLMAMVATEAIAEAWPAERPFVVSRSGFAGIQRYAQTWSGDNLTSWRTLKYNVATILGVSALLLQPKSLFAISLFAAGIGLCGVVHHGCDIGGFWGPRPTAELLVRWVQNGVFQPRFSIHSCNQVRVHMVHNSANFEECNAGA